MRFPRAPEKENKLAKGSNISDFKQFEMSLFITRFDAFSATRFLYVCYAWLIFVQAFSQVWFVYIDLHRHIIFANKFWHSIWFNSATHKHTHTQIVEALNRGKRRKTDTWSKSVAKFQIKSTLLQIETTWLYGHGQCQIQRATNTPTTTLSPQL